MEDSCVSAILDIVVELKAIYFGVLDSKKLTVFLIKKQLNGKL